MTKAIDILNIRAAMDEALNVQVTPVDRPHWNGTSEPWLEVTYRGRHVGWLPADTNLQRAINQARRWLRDDRQIHKAAMAKPMPSAAGAIINKLMERDTNQ